MILTDEQIAKMAFRLDDGENLNALITSHREQSKLIEDQKKRIEELERHLDNLYFEQKEN